MSMPLGKNRKHTKFTTKILQLKLLSAGRAQLMARPRDPSLGDIRRGDDELRSIRRKSLFDKSVDCLSNGTTRHLGIGTLTAKPTKPLATVTTPTADPSERPPLPPPDPPPPPIPLTEPFKPNEEPNIFLEKPTFIPPPKPISHSPKISPSSIPNPSPSVTTNKQVEPGYPNYSNFLYNIPGYSAFQPVSFPGIIQPNQAPIPQNEPERITEFVPFPPKPKEAVNEEKSETTFEEMKPTEPIAQKKDAPKPQTDFEDHFTPEIIPAVPISEKNKLTECKMSITSLTQGSGGTITIPAQVTQIPQITQASDVKKKPNERFSLKTSIPISKIDMKCVNNQPDNILQSSLTKKPIQSQPFLNQKIDNGPRVEIQSNIVIKKPDIPATKEPEVKPMSPKPIPVPERKSVSPMANNSINALINAAEVINKNESQFRKPEPKPEALNEIKDPSPSPMPQTCTAITRPIFNPINIESNKVNFTNKPAEGYNEQKNQILFIQNKNPSNPKMLLTIQQPNPQVLLQRTNFDSKNLQAPSRLSSQTKKSKDEINENGSSSKVVALKRLHQENCDENDFENLITENQIYGNKIVVKEKSQGTLQEQDLKNKVKIDKPMQTETKNVVLQPNFLYLSNVQFPNLMMIKNNSKVTQNNDTKIIKQSPNENKANEVNNKINTEQNLIIQTSKNQTASVSKEIHILKSSNNVLQTLSNNNSKTDLVFQTQTPKVIMSPQIVYQVPMIVDTDNKLIQQSINREYPKFVNKQKEYSKQDQGKPNDKVFIACPYQMDTKLQPKIVITNIRPKVAKAKEVSTIDLYEKRRRIRRLKYLTNREAKDQKADKDPKVNETAERDIKKPPDKPEKVSLRNVITPAKMKAEIYKEFTRTKETVEVESSESESDYGEEDIGEYESIINEYSVQKDDQTAKVDFLSNFMLATHEMRKDKEMDKQERMIQRDSVAAAYITVGRLDRLYNEDNPETPEVDRLPPTKVGSVKQEGPVTKHKKMLFLKQLDLAQVSPQCRDGYEKTWQEIMKERNRRNGVKQPQETPAQPATENMELDPNGQLQLLTEIKKSVNENNNLIKMRLDSPNNDDGESIKDLAEKNFSELNRLSKMADESVKIFSGQDTKKRDLNPGFDSENIQKAILKLNPIPNYASLKIPNISKIISLKSQEEESVATSTPATSMDEPKNCAAGTEIFDGNKRDFCCQFEDLLWPGIEAVAKSFRELEAGRKKEISELQRRSTLQRVARAHAARRAARDAERARALRAERLLLARDERALRDSVQRLTAAIEAVRNC